VIFPFDPIKRSKSIESFVMKGDQRRYYRFRWANFYGPNGIITADATGCNLLCAYCWNYFRNKNPLGMKDLGFFTPNEVSEKLKSMGKSHDCDKYRISGCEPFLGEASTQHLASIIKSMPSSNFIIESNGLKLGYNPALIGHLVGLKNAQIRIAVKADNPETFERVTGAIGSYQHYQLRAVKELRAKGISVSVAYMEEFVNPALLGLGSNEDFDTEGLRYYQGTKARLSDRGILNRTAKAIKPVFRPQQVKPKEGVEQPVFWIDKGDIT